MLDQIGQATGGTVTVHRITNEAGEVVHAFATMSMPLPKTHWIYQKDDTPAKLNRRQFEKAIRAAGKYAVRCATMNGTEMDFDPDALLQNLVVGMLGYWTETGLTTDPEDSAWCDPQAPFDFTEPAPRNFPSGDIGQGCPEVL